MIQAIPSFVDKRYRLIRHEFATPHALAKRSLGALCHADLGRVLQPQPSRGAAAVNSGAQRLGSRLTPSRWAPALRYGFTQFTVLSVLADAAVGLLSASTAAPAGIVTTIVPLAVMPVTETV